MPNPSSVFATVSHHYAVSSEKVFDAWLDTAMIGRFMFGPEVRDEEIINLQTDARVEGSFSFVVSRKEVKINHMGEYLQIDRPGHLVFTWAVEEDLPDRSLVVIHIVPDSTGCQLTLTQEMPVAWSDFIDKVKSAWTTMLEALDRVLKQE